MRYIRHAATLTLLIIAWSAPMPAAQGAAAPAAPAPVTLTPAQMEEFLLRAKIVRTRGVGTGVTNTRRATLSDGVLTRDAQIQIIDQALAVFQARGGAPEINFKDSYRYNDSMKTLTPDEVATAIGSSLTRYEIQAVLARRDAIVKLFEARIAERGERAVIYTLGR